MARQVTALYIVVIMKCWARVKVPADLCDHFHVNTARPDVRFLYVVLRGDFQIQRLHKCLRFSPAGLSKGRGGGGSVLLLP